MQTLRIRSQPPSPDEAGLVDCLSTQPDVVVAYLFGSLAKGRAASRSDVDIAILFADASDPLAMVVRVSNTSIEFPGLSRQQNAPSERPRTPAALFKRKETAHYRRVVS